jgi:Domain of unknown function (DUF1707)
VANAVEYGWSGFHGSRVTLLVRECSREVPVVAGPGDEIAAGAEGRGQLRASHADREQVIGTLKAAFVQGRLVKDEFDLRVGQALAHQTHAELAAMAFIFSGTASPYYQGQSGMSGGHGRGRRQVGTAAP